MTSLRLWVVAVTVGVAACRDAAPLQGVVLDPATEAPAVRIADADGRVFDLASERGEHTVVLYFGYTHCPDMCPTMLADWARARQMLGPAADRIRWVFVSVDPGRDTPKIARDYARQFDSTFVGLSPSPAQLDSLTRAWGFMVELEGDPATSDTYTVAHPASAYVVDRAGRLREKFPFVMKAEQMASDLRQLR